MSNQSQFFVVRLFVAILILGLGSTLATSQETTLKIGVVDIEQVVAESPQGQELQTRLEAFQSEVQAQLDVMQEEARAIGRRIAEGTNTLSQDRITQLEKEYEDAGIAIRRYRDDKQREGQKMQEEGLKVIEQVLKPVFEQARSEMGLDIIFNRVPGVIILTSDKVDITPAMIERVAAVAGATED
jgi:Skp family chaperone for outer membrane proteins